MNTRILLLAISLVIPLGARAASAPTFDFDQIWTHVQRNAPDAAAAEHDAESAKIAARRASRHWYPRVFAEGRAYSTNDPAQSFMSLLGQREILATDFAPDALGQPPAKTYGRGSIGLDFPLFEGGMKSAQADVARSMAEAKAHERQATLRALYASTATAYATLLVLEDQRAQLENLKAGVEQTLAGYGVGARSNPVGYSGLLGLKGLRNRLNGLLAETTAQSAALGERIRLLARELPEGWKPTRARAKDFLASRLAITDRGAEPPAVQAAQAAAQAIDRTRDAERARFLPHVGLFADGTAYTGERSTETSYSAGAYLKWELFSAPNFGAVDQARHSAAAAEARAASEILRAQVTRTAALGSIEALERNLSLMDESAKLLEEQSATARTLFQNGSINALQLVEVLARRADLLVNRTDAEIKLAESRAAVILNSGASYEK